MPGKTGSQISSPRSRICRSNFDQQSLLEEKPMRSVIRPLTCVLFAACLLAVVAFAGAQQGAAAESEEGFTPLFNGKDLTGWVYASGKPVGKGYQVKDGVLFCTEKDGGNLFTEKEYSDFAFRFEFKMEDSGNNGVGIRSPLQGDPAYEI